MLLLSGFVGFVLINLPDLTHLSSVPRPNDILYYTGDIEDRKASR